jgi:hypothetical protein
MSQKWINLLLWLWTTFHDFVYVGLYMLYQNIRFHFFKKKHRTIDERVETLEKILRSWAVKKPRESGLDISDVERGTEQKHD